jgi:hypothetical protein
MLESAHGNGAAGISNSLVHVLERETTDVVGGESRVADRQEYCVACASTITSPRLMPTRQSSHRPVRRRAFQWRAAPGNFTATQAARWRSGTRRGTRPRCFHDPTVLARDAGLDDIAKNSNEPAWGARPRPYGGCTLGTTDAAASQTAVPIEANRPFRLKPARDSDEASRGGGAKHRRGEWVSLRSRDISPCSDRRPGDFIVSRTRMSRLSRLTRAGKFL